MLLLTNCAGKEFQIFKILLKKCFASFDDDDDLEAIVTSGAYEIGSYIVVYVDIIRTVESFEYLN